MRLWEYNDETWEWVETTLRPGDAFENDIEAGTIMIVRKKKGGGVTTLAFSPSGKPHVKPFPSMMASKFRETCNGMVNHLGLGCKAPQAWYYLGKSEIRGYTCELERAS